MEYIFNQSGPMTMGASQVCGFIKSDPSKRNTKSTISCSAN